MAFRVDPLRPFAFCAPQRFANMFFSEDFLMVKPGGCVILFIPSKVSDTDLLSDPSLGIFWYVSAFKHVRACLLNPDIVLRLAATLGARGRKGINKKQILDADISEACQKIMNPPEPIALRTSAGLMMGVVK